MGFQQCCRTGRFVSDWSGTKRPFLDSFVFLLVPLVPSNNTNWNRLLATTRITRYSFLIIYFCQTGNKSKRKSNQCTKTSWPCSIRRPQSIWLTRSSTQRNTCTRKSTANMQPQYTANTRRSPITTNIISKHNCSTTCTRCTQASRALKHCPISTISCFSSISWNTTWTYSHCSCLPYACSKCCHTSTSNLTMPTSRIGYSWANMSISCISIWSAAYVFICPVWPCGKTWPYSCFAYYMPLSSTSRRHASAMHTKRRCSFSWTTCMRRVPIWNPVFPNTVNCTRERKRPNCRMSRIRPIRNVAILSDHFRRKPMKPSAKWSCIRSESCGSLCKAFVLLTKLRNIFLLVWQNIHTRPNWELHKQGQLVQLCRANVFLCRIGVQGRVMRLVCQTIFYSPLFSMFFFFNLLAILCAWQCHSGFESLCGNDKSAVLSHALVA